MKVIPVFLLMWAMTACTLTPGQQSAYDKACSGLRGVYAVFSAVREVASPQQELVVDAAYKNTIPFCVNPPADRTEAAVRIAGASLAIWKVYRSVQ